MIQIKRGAATVATVNPTSSSNMSKAVMGEEQITLVWEAPAFVPFYLGDYITFEGSNWTLNKLPTVKKLSGKTWQYNGVFQSTKYELIKAMYLLFDNTDTLPSGEFPLTGTAETFMELLIANLNRVAGSAVWSVGQVIENTDYKNLTFSNEDCLSVLGRLADEFETEYHVTNHVIHLKKISTNREVTLQYGSTLYDIERSSVDSSDVCTRLYAFGSTKNLASDYRGGNSPLRLPDANGNYIENNVNLYGVIERSKTFEDIYPRLSSGGAGVITSVGDEFTFYDSALDFNVNDYLLDGTKAKVHFNTGECAGYDFEIALYNHSTKKFVLIANTQENDFTLPSADLKPAVGDKYVLIDIVMPPAYLAAAEAELVAKSQEFISQNSTPKVSYKTTFSAIYAKQNLQNVECGDTVTVYDEDMGIDEQIRIIKQQKGLTDFWTVQFDLANTVTATRLERIEGNVSAVENTVIVTNQRVNRNNLRAYQWTKELQEMVFDPDGYFDPQNIKPLSIETTMVSVSAKSQIFQLSSLLQPNYAANPQVLQWNAGLLTHFTISDNAITEWIISQGSITITGVNQTKALYMYARCLRSGSTGDIYLAPVALKFNEGSTYYYFLIGVLHTPINSVRGISLNYGQTTINGQFIKTGVITSIDGATYFNLNTGEIGGNIKFKATDGSYKTVDQAIGDVQIGGKNLLSGTKDSITNVSFGAGIGYSFFTGIEPISSYGLSVGDYVTLAFNVLNVPSANYIGAALVFEANGSYIYMAGQAIYQSGSRAVLTYKLPTGTTGIATYMVMNPYPTTATVIGYSKLKLEKGNKATDWTPAPEDIQSQIDTSNGLLADIASDNKLTPNEKQQVKKEWDDIYNEFPFIRDMGNDVLGAADNYEDSYYYLSSYISPLLSNLTTTSDIIGSTFRSYFRNYYLARETIKDDINRAVDSQSRSLDFMKSAIENGSTEINGGLALVNLLFQKTLAGIVNGGMSGLEGDSILNWGGSTYQQVIADAAKAFGAAMSSAFLNKEDGGGHLAFGKIAWDALGKLMVGNFNILNGNIIGKDSAGAEKIRLSTENVPDISSLTNNYTYTQTDVQARGNCEVEVLFDSQTSDYYIQINSGSQSASVTLTVTLPYATNLIVEAGTLESSVNGGAVTVTGMTQSVVVKNSGGATIASGNTGAALVIPSAGTYTVIITTNIILVDNGYEQQSEISFTSHNNIKYSENVKKTAIGLDGLYSYFSEIEHFYFKSGVGARYRGAWDVPAGLGGGRVSSTGSISGLWGILTKAGNGASKSGSDYTLTHYIGNTDYSLILTPKSSNVPYFLDSNRGVNTIIATCSGGFDFVLIRTK